MSQSWFDGAVRQGLTALTAFAMVTVGVTDVAAQGTGTVTGMVRDALSRAPLPGAQVSVEGTGIGGLANNVGRFLFLNVPAGEHTIQAQLIGYRTVSLTVSVTADQTTAVDFDLRQEALALEGVVVTGTAGTARRREIGNQISQVTSEDIELAAVTDLGDILQGRTTGVQINDFGGQVGQASQIRLRGNSSLTQGNNPLIYIDGIRMKNNELEEDDDEAGASSSVFDMINPNDIERIEVVKGPAATTLYGTEAAGGVIQIFTKRGSAGAPAWTFSMDGGLHSMPFLESDLNPKSINPTGFQMNDCSRTQRFNAETMQFEIINQPEPGCPESGSWFRKGYFHRYNLSVRGGGETANYFVSGRWESEDGVVDPQGQESYGIRANVAFTPFQGLNISLNNNYQHRKIQWIPDGNNASGLSLNVMRGTAGYTTGNDDSLVLDNEVLSDVDLFQTGASVTWAPNNVWDHRLTVGMDYSLADFIDWKPWGFYDSPNADRENDELRERNLTFDYSGSINYSPFSEITSRFSFGGQLYEEFTYRLNAFDEQFAGPGDALIGDGTNRDVAEDRLRVRSGGFFLQEALGFSDRLFITAGVRWDGFSTFGEGFGLATYPKLSASYLISDESFWPTGVVEQLKLRAAWGQSGKAPGAFEAEKLWEAADADEQVPAVIIDNLGNADLGPEKSTEIEFGFDLSAFDGRVTLEFTKYDQTTKDALIGVNPTPSTGTDNSVLRNLGEVKNWGTETALSVIPVRMDDVEWSVGVQWSTNDSEITDLGPLEELDGGRQVGRPLYIAYDDVLTNPGQIGVAPILADTMIGRLFPTDIVSLRTRVTLWRSVTLDVVGEGQYGHVRPVGPAYQNMRRTTLDNPVWPYCAPIVAQWQATAGPNSNRIANSGLTTDQISQCIQQYSDQGVWTTAADFFKLRSATLSWRLPEAWIPRARSVQLSLQGKNLFKFTDYYGLDPEAQDNGFEDTTPNDYYTFGQPRTFIFGVTVNF